MKKKLTCCALLLALSSLSGMAKQEEMTVVDHQIASWWDCTFLPRLLSDCISPDRCDSLLAQLVRLGERHTEGRSTLSAHSQFSRLGSYERHADC